MNVLRLHKVEPEPVAYLPPAPNDDMPAGDFDLRALFRVFLARRLVILGTIVLGLTLAGIVVLQLTPVYSASTLIMVGQRENKVLDPEALITGLNNDSATIENQIQILRSWTLVERVAAKLNLARDPEFNARGARRSLLSRLNPLTWLAPAAPKVPRGAAAKPGVDPAIIKSVGSRLTVAAVGRSSVIKVTFESSDRAKAAMIADAIADQYIVDQLETKFDASKRTSDWLNERLAQLAEQVRVAENAVEQYKDDNGISSGKDGGNLATEQVSEINGQIVLARSNLSEQEAKYRQVEKLLRAGGSVDAIAAVINSSLISGLRTQQADLLGKEAELATKYGDRHPQMIALRDQKKGLDAKIEVEIKRITRNLANEVAVARTRVSSLEGSLNQMQGTATVQGKASIKLRELEREVQASRTLYDTFQARSKQTEDKEKIQAADSRRLDKAQIPNEASFPNKTMIMGVTLFGSAVMGMLIALMMERLDNGFRTGVEVERMLRVSNLAVTPMLKGVKHVADRVVQKPLSAFSESIRSLHAGLQLSNIDRPPKVILVTSSVPNEGKTSIAVSLGRLAAKGGSRVILIDGDLRHPSVGRMFSPRRPDAGLVEVLAGKRDLASVLHRDPISPLEFLPVSSTPSNPADILTSNAMRKLVEFLRQHYDLIIIDAAPVLPVSDTRLLSRLADKVVYVVKWDATPREAVLSGFKLLRDANADIAGTILNQADLRRHALYGYGDSTYGYGGHYAKYYSE